MLNLYNACASFWAQQFWAQHTDPANLGPKDRDTLIICRLYLVDWKHTLNTNKQLLKWRKPFQAEIPICDLRYRYFMDIIVNADIEQAIKYIESITIGYSLSRTIKLVASSFPMMNSKPGDDLDLVRSAAEYKLNALLQ